MTIPNPTDRVIAQGRALICTIEPTNRLERKLARLLLHVYKRRLRGIVEAVPAWVSEEILSASEHIGDQRAALWMSDN